MPLSSRELLFQKWLGVMLCDWPLVGLMAAVAIPVALTGIIHPIGLLLYIFSAAVTVGLLAALGLAVGVNARSPFRAALGAFFAVYLLANLLGGIGTAISQPMPLKNIQGLIPVFFPPFVAGPFIDRAKSSLTVLIEASIACLMGTAVYAWLGYACFSIAVARFGTGRK